MSLQDDLFLADTYLYRVICFQLISLQVDLFLPDLSTGQNVSS